MEQKQERDYIYDACLQAHSEVKDIDEHPKTFCMTKETFDNWIKKAPDEDGIVVYLVKNAKDIPTSVVEWIKVTMYADYVESRCGKWEYIKAKKAYCKEREYGK